MARIRIELPASFTFQTEILLRITDINYGGHLGNDAVLGLVHEARLQFLKHLGYTELDVGGASLIMADVGIRYLSEAFHGDTLLIQVAPGEFTSHGFDVLFKLTSKNSGKDVAHAKTGLVAFDYTTRKVVTLPDAFKEALTEPLKNLQS